MKTNGIKRMAGLFLLAACFGVAAARGQSGVGAPILMDAGGSRLDDERLDARLGQRPISQEDRTLKTGRELMQGEAIVAVRPPPPPQTDPSNPRVRARALLEEDRARVKRVVATAD